MADDPEEAARRRAAPFRLILLVQMADIVVGVLLVLFWSHVAVAGRVFGLPVMKFVGIALIVIGCVGFGLFAVLARLAAANKLP